MADRGEDSIHDWEPRTCPKCKESRPGPSFRNSKGNRRPWCAECRHTYNQRLSARGKPERPPVPEGETVELAKGNPLDALTTAAERAGMLKYKAMTERHTMKRRMAWKAYFSAWGKVEALKGRVR